MVLSNSSAQFFPRGCRPVSVLLEYWGVFIIEEITNLPTVGKKANDRFLTFSKSKDQIIMRNSGTFFVQQMPVE